jgi:hypothetical protein
VRLGGGGGGAIGYSGGGFSGGGVCEYGFGATEAWRGA